MRMGSAALRRALGMLVVVAGTAGASHGQAPTTGPRTSPNNSISSTTSVGTIEGRVVLPSGHPISNRVRIKLSTSKDPGMTLYTDNNGAFTFGNLSEGTYNIEAADDRGQFDPGTEQVRLARGGRVTLEISLKDKKEDVKAKPAGAIVSASEADEKVPAAAKREFEAASKLAADGNAESAIEHLKRAVELYPNYLTARNNLGVQYLKLKKLDEAAEQFEAAIEINPKAYNPRLNLGIVKVAIKHFSEAIDQLSQAVATDSSQAAGHLYLGVARLGSDDLDGAERELLKALELGGPPYSVAHYHLAGVHLKRGDRDGAIHELEAYLAASPSGEEGRRATRLLEQLKQN